MPSMRGATGLVHARTLPSLERVALSRIDDSSAAPSPAKVQSKVAQASFIPRLILFVMSIFKSGRIKISIRAYSSHI